MLKLCLRVYVFSYTVFEAIGNPPDVDIFNKFQQHDYKLKLERADVASYDKRFAKRYEVITYKHNQTCVALNGTFQFNIDIGNQLQVVVQAYKFMSNEYRYFPLRFQVNFCFAISKNLGGVGKMFDCVNFTPCPFLKSRVLHMCNFTPDESKLPPFIPSGRYMIELQSMYQNTEVAIIQVYGEVYRPIVIPE